MECFRVLSGGVTFDVRREVFWGLLQGCFGLGCGDFVGLTSSRLFLGLFIGTGGFGEIWGSPTCNRLSRTLNRDKKLLCSACSAECT